MIPPSSISLVIVTHTVSSSIVIDILYIPVAMTDSLKMKWQNHAEKMLQDFADQYPENAKEWHEGLIRSHAESNVPSAKTAKIR